MNGKRIILCGCILTAVLFSLFFGCSACTPQPESTLREMYGDHYLQQGGEHFYVFTSQSTDESKTNLAGLKEDQIDKESPYELSFVRVISKMQMNDRTALQFLEYEITNHRDYDTTLHMEQYIVERKIAGSWYTCISEGESRFLELKKLPSEEPITRQILLSRSVYTDKDMNHMQWEDLPAGHYRLLQKFDTQYTVMEFDIP